MNQAPLEKQSQEVDRLKEDFASRKASERPIPPCVARAYRKVMDQKRAEQQETGA